MVRNPFEMTSGERPRDKGRFAWQDDALCAQTDPEAFFPDPGTMDKITRRVCEICGVRPACLDYALKFHPLEGFIAGTSRNIRDKMVAQRRKAGQITAATEEEGVA